MLPSDWLSYYCFVFSVKKKNTLWILDMIKSAASLSCSNMFYFTVIDNLVRKLFKASHFNFPGQGFLKARFRLFASLWSSPAIVTRFNLVTKVLSTGRRENLGTRLCSI